MIWTVSWLQRTFNYRGEGWAAQDGRMLILSDGTSRLRFLDPETFDLRREVEVLDGDSPVDSAQRAGVHPW
jgi:glutamine cyclotransferase